MSVSYNITIPDNSLITMNINGQELVVTAIQYNISATDGSNTVNSMGLAVIPFDENSEFTAFSNLTQDQIKNWIETSDPLKIQAQKSHLIVQLDKLANPPQRPQVQKNPWSD